MTNILTFLIIAITVITSMRAFNDEGFKNRAIFRPVEINERREWWRFLSNGFIHADWTHLIFNMLTLYFFGRKVEEYFHYYFDKKGGLLFILLYIGGLIISSLPSFVKHKNNPYYASLGASGAVSAVLFAAIIMDPTSKLLVFFIPMTGFLFGLIYLGYSWYMSEHGHDNIGHDAHFWGAVFGIVFTLALRPKFFSEFIAAVSQGGWLF